MKIKTAEGVSFRKCSCGCEHTYVYLHDIKGNMFARFSIESNQWVEFGEDVARVHRDEEPIGPRPEARPH